MFPVGGSNLEGSYLKFSSNTSYFNDADHPNEPNQTDSVNMLQHLPIEGYKVDLGLKLVEVHLRSSSKLTSIFHFPSCHSHNQSWLPTIPKHTHTTSHTPNMPNIKHTMYSYVQFVRFIIYFSRTTTHNPRVGFNWNFLVPDTVFFSFLLSTITFFIHRIINF